MTDPTNQPDSQTPESREAIQIIEHTELLQDCKGFVIQAIELHTKHTEGGYEAYHDKIEKLSLELSDFVTAATRASNKALLERLKAQSETWDDSNEGLVYELTKELAALERQQLGKEKK